MNNFQQQKKRKSTVTHIPTFFSFFLLALFLLAFKKLDFEFQTQSPQLTETVLLINIGGAADSPSIDVKDHFTQSVTVKAFLLYLESNHL